MRSWHIKYIEKNILASVQVQSDKERIKVLERENKELKQANEIIRKAAAFFTHAELDCPLKWRPRIDENKHQYEAELICRVLPIAPSTYYRAKDLSDNFDKRSLRSQHNNFYVSEISLIWQDSKCRYDARKVWQQMKADGVKVARFTVDCLTKQHGLQGVWRSKNKMTTNSHNVIQPRK